MFNVDIISGENICIGKIMVFVNPHWSIGSADVSEETGIFDQFTSTIKRALEKLGLLILIRLKIP